MSKRHRGRIVGEYPTAATAQPEPEQDGKRDFAQMRPPFAFPRLLSSASRRSLPQAEKGLSDMFGGREVWGGGGNVTEAPFRSMG